MILVLVHSWIVPSQLSHAYSIVFCYISVEVFILAFTQLSLQVEIGTQNEEKHIGSKSLKNVSYSKFRAKRAMLTFWVDKSSLKMPNIDFLKTGSFRSKSVTRHDNFNWTYIGGKMSKLKNFNCDILGNFQTQWKFIWEWVKASSQTKKFLNEALKRKSLWK